MELTQEKSKAMIYLLGGIVLIVLIVVVVQKVFGSWAEMLNKLGLTDSKETKEQKENISDAVKKANSDTSASPWSILYYQNAKAGTPLPSVAMAKNVAKDIYNSVGYFTDDPAKALAAFKLLPNKASVSFVASQFRLVYGYDLLTWLKDKFDTDHQVEVMNSIVDYVNHLK